MPQSWRDRARAALADPLTDFSSVAAGSSSTADGWQARAAAALADPIEPASTSASDWRTRAMAALDEPLDEAPSFAGVRVGSSTAAAEPSSLLDWLSTANERARQAQVEFPKGVVSGLASQARGLAGSARMAGAVSASTNPLSLVGEAIGAPVAQAATRVQAKLAPPEDISRDLADDPKQLLDPRWWTRHGGQMLGAIAPYIAASAFSGPGAAVGNVLLESSVAAGNAFEDALAAGKSRDEAARIATSIVGKNALLLGATKGIGRGAGALSFARGVVAEGLQETGQQAIENVEQGRPAPAGLANAAVLGTLGGAGMATAPRLSRSTDAPGTGAAPAPDVRPSAPAGTRQPSQFSETGKIDTSRTPIDAAAVRQRFEQDVQQRTPDLVAEYRRRFGNLVNSDLAKELSPDYAASKDSRARYASAVHPGSSRLARAVFDDLLRESAPTGPEKPLAVFTAGGPGSGKSSGLDLLPTLRSRAHVTYDSTLRKYEGAVRDIEAARAAGHEVAIVYTYRPVEKAFLQGVMKRARDPNDPEAGRTVPIATHVQAHREALDTMRRLALRYRNVPDVTIDVIDNRGNLGDRKRASLDFLSEVAYDQDADVQTTLRAFVDREVAAGRLDTATAESFRGARPELAGRPDRPRFAGDASQLPPAGQSGQANDYQPVSRPRIAPPKGALVAADEPPGRIPAAEPLTSTQKRADLTSIQNKIDLPAPQRAALDEILVEHDHFATQRRGVQSVERTERLAQAIAVDVQRPLQKGTALNAEQTLAYRNVLTSLTDQIAEASDNVSRGTATDWDRANLEKLQLEQLAVFQSMWGARAEAGRALNQWRAVSRAMETRDARVLQQLSKSHGWERTKELATKIAALREDPVAQYALLRNEAKQRGGKLKSYLYANLLSGIETHERNLVSNAINTTLNIAGDVATGKPGAATAQLFGAVSGLSKATKEMLFTLQHGFSHTDVQDLDLDRIYNEFRGGLANPFNVPGRALQAADQFARTLVREAELYRAAYTTARQEGAKGKALPSRIAQLRAEPTPEMVSAANDIATRSVFQESPGAISSAVLRARHALDRPGMPIGTVIVPFVRVAANMARQGVELSPIGFAMPSGRASGRIGEAARARATVGTLLLPGIAMLAAAGNLTGSGPSASSSGERENFRETKQPDSVRIGDRWVSYRSWGPVATVLSFVANGFEAVREGQLSGEGWERAVQAFLPKVGRSFMNQSFLQGISNVLEAATDPSGRAGERFARGVTGMFVPLVGLQRSVSRAIDPTVRDPQNILESVTANVPGLSTTVQPRMNRWGEPERYESVPLTAGLLQTKAVKRDPLVEELQRLGLSIGKPSVRAPEGQTLDAATAFGVRRDKGQALRTALDQLIASPRYQRATDAQKAEVLEYVRDRTNRASNQRARSILPQPKARAQ